MHNQRVIDAMDRLRNGTLKFKDVDDHQILQYLIQIIRDDISEGKSTGHERKFLREYEKYMEGKSNG